MTFSNALMRETFRLVDRIRRCFTVKSLDVGDPQGSCVRAPSFQLRYGMVLLGQAPSDGVKALHVAWKQRLGCPRC